MCTTDEQMNVTIMWANRNCCHSIVYTLANTTNNNKNNKTVTRKCYEKFYFHFGETRTQKKDNKNNNEQDPRHFDSAFQQFCLFLLCCSLWRAFKCVTMTHPEFWLCFKQTRSKPEKNGDETLTQNQTKQTINIDDWLAIHPFICFAFHSVAKVMDFIFAQ